MIKKFTQSIKKDSLLKKGERVLVCVSGGADSVAMLYAFKTISAKMQLKLFIAHLNHLLRGRESDNDRFYVLKLAKRLSIPVYTKNRDVKAFAKENKLSLEDAARRVRYDFFKTTADSADADVIATAHTKDDQAETVLMRLLRGTGLKGLCGIPVKAVLGNAVLIRPMLDISRKEIEAYLKTKRIKPRIDSSNADVRFFRNRVRKELIPFLRKNYSQSIKEQIATLALLLNTDYEYIKLKQEKDFKLLLKKGKGTVSFSIQGFKRAHPSLKRALIRRAIEDLGKGLEGIDYKHCREMESLISERPAGSVVNLPHKIRAEKLSRIVKLGIYDKKQSRKRTTEPKIIKIPGVTRFNRKRIAAGFIKNAPDFSKKVKRVEYLDADKVVFPLFVRMWKQGDRMIPLGMKKAKKLSDIFVDKKIPGKSRANTPLIISAEGDIICACGIGISDTCRLNINTKKILRLELLTR